MELRKTFRFEASHILPKHPGKCSRLHGHSWVLHVSVKGPINPATGFVMDYAEISNKVRPLIEDLDHKHLGAWHGLLWSIDSSRIADEKSWRVGWLPDDFYPSSENLIYRIAERLLVFGLDWDSLALEETCTSYAVLTREEYTQSTLGKVHA